VTRYSAPTSTVRLWDTRTRQLIGALDGNAAVSTVAFSPDGRTLAIGGFNSSNGRRDGDVRLWDVRTRKPIGAHLTPTGRVVQVAFSPDGHSLAASLSVDAPATDSPPEVESYTEIRLWDVRTRQQIGAPLTDITGSVSAVAFSPDGRTLISNPPEGDEPLLWDLSLPSDLYAVVCAIPGRPITREEWKRYTPGQPFHAICS
jgi:WD40 repeat protein